MRPTRARIAALALMVQALSLPVEVFAMLASRAPYDPLVQTMSDLASTTCTDLEYPRGPVAVCSPAHDLVNGSWILAGTAMVVAVLALRGAPPPDSPRPRRTASVLLVVLGLSTALTGLVPVDMDLLWHTVLSGPSILLGPVAAAFALAAWLPGSPSRRRRLLIRALGALPTLAAIAMVLTLDGFGTMGLLQRIAVWVPVIALAALGARLWGAASPTGAGRALRPA